MLFIQANIEAPWIMLDFPTLDRFINEIKTIQYDIIGIGSITINVLKVKKMCELVRQYQPDATIVAGGTSQICQNLTNCGNDLFD